MTSRDANSTTLSCYRCGGSLVSLTLPLSRLDLCPDCGVELHVCRMCRHYAPSEPDACDEDDAPEVRGKTSANFCDYFVPDANAFDGREHKADEAARQQLQSLFGEENSADREDHGADLTLEAAEKLFRK